MLNERQKATIDFALCYFLCNSDDESVIEHLENSTNSAKPSVHSDYIRYIQNIIDKIE